MLSKQKNKKFTFSSESFHQCHYTDHSHDQHIDKLPNCKTNIPNTATITYWNITTVIIPSIAELLLLYLRCTTQPCFNHSPTSTGVQPAPTPKPTRQGWDVLMELNFFIFFMSKKPNQTHCYGSMSFWLKLTNLWTVQAALMFLWKRDGSSHLVDVAPLLRSTGGKEVTPSNFNYIQDPFPQPSPSQDYLNLQLVPFLFKF